MSNIKRTAIIKKIQEQDKQIIGKSNKLYSFLLHDTGRFTSINEARPKTYKQLKKPVLRYDLTSFEWDGLHILYDDWNEIRARRQQEIVENTRMENDVEPVRRDSMYAQRASARCSSTWKQSNELIRIETVFSTNDFK